MVGLNSMLRKKNQKKQGQSYCNHFENIVNAISVMNLVEIVIFAFNFLQKININEAPQCFIYNSLL